jgi:hypothetical protein
MKRQHFLFFLSHDETELLKRNPSPKHSTWNVISKKFLPKTTPSHLFVSPLSFHVKTQGAFLATARSSLAPVLKVAARLKDDSGEQVAYIG